MKTTKDFLSTLGTKLLMYPIGFISSIIVARILGPEDRGIYAYILLIISFAIPILSFGFGAGILYNLSSEKFKLEKVFFS